MENSKKIFIVFMISLLLSSCTFDHAQAEPYSSVIEVMGQSAVVVFDQDTLSSGKIKTENGEYRFRYETSPNEVKFTLVYPDGYIHSQTRIGSGIVSSVDYDSAEREAKGYLDALSLQWAIEDTIERLQGRKEDGPFLFLAFVLVGGGIFQLLKPKTVWWLAHGWRYKNAEPSDLALAQYGISGIIFAVVGILCLIASL